ncbi:PD-(D/E)XK nuclease family protein [Alphaproteobacteria bacterium]|nr:PD-(D/E)XK nuclease family protein [Alphaproteobacteria bacterium]
MARHRGVYNPLKSEPYELSRSRIENFVKCPACFYLQQVEGIKFPSIPGYNINEATDVLLKRDFDEHRKAGTCHPFLKENGLEKFIPLKDDRFELWTQSLHFGAEGRFNTVHEETNLKVGGGLDDVWLNTETGHVHLVDYKSTSQKSPDKEITLDDWWKASYKRQMDFYIWVMRRLGLDTSDVGYFLYCDGDRFTEAKFLHQDHATMQFKMTLLAYESDLSWIEPTLLKIKQLLQSAVCPNHTERCEHGAFLAECAQVGQHGLLS